MAEQPIDLLGVRKVRMDASTTCQLRCPLCSTGQRMPGIGWGHLRFSDFKTFVDQNANVEAIELSNYGEVFLNPELADIFRYAHGRGVGLTIDGGANLNMLRPADAESLVRYEVRSLTIALDGATSETYGRYRLGGDFDRVLANIECINELKRELQSDLPALTWQFVVFGHNEHELPLARQMARERAMRFRVKLSWDSQWSPVRNLEVVRLETESGAATREEYKTKYGREYVIPCYQLWREPVINWDGRLLGCCINRNFGDFGNVFDSGLDQLLNSERYQYAREMLQGRVPAHPEVPCTNCPRYHDMQKTQRWLDVASIAGK